MAGQEPTRRQSQGENLEGFNIYRRKSQWDIPRSYSVGKAVRRGSLAVSSQKQPNCDILVRTNKKNSVANAVAVIGVTKALLIGLLSRDKNEEEDLYSLISSNTDLVNTASSCTDLTRQIVFSNIHRSESEEDLISTTGYQAMSTARSEEDNGSSYTAVRRASARL